MEDLEPEKKVAFSCTELHSREVMWLLGCVANGSRKSQDRLNSLAIMSMESDITK